MLNLIIIPIRDECWLNIGLQILTKYWQFLVNSTGNIAVWKYSSNIVPTLTELQVLKVTHADFIINCYVQIFLKIQ